MDLFPPMRDRSDRVLAEVLSDEVGTWTPMALQQAEAEFARRQLPREAITAAAASRELEAKTREKAGIPVPQALAAAVAFGVSPSVATLMVLAILAIGLDHHGYKRQARVIRWVVGGFTTVAVVGLGAVFAAVLVRRAVGS